MKNLFTRRCRKISLLDIAIFFRQLSTLVKANIPLMQSFNILFQSQKNISLQLIIQSIKKEIEMGRGLSKGLQKFPHLFNELICQLIQTGEQTGTLEKILILVATHLEKSVAIRNQIKQALFYPMTVLCISLLVCLGMLIFIVPRFAEFFQNMHGQLPLFTLIIVKLSECLREEYWLGILFIGGGVLAFKSLAHSISFKRKLQQWLFGLPLINHLFNKIFILHFARNLAIVYAAGVNIADALKMISMTYYYSGHSNAVRHLRNKVLSGQQLNIAARTCSLFPPLVTQMMRIGEESGTLQQMLESIVTIYEGEIDRIITRMNQILEPLIMIILGVLIGGLIIAMYLPIFKLGMMI